MKIVLFGNGKMGKLVRELALKKGHEVLASFSLSNPAEKRMIQSADVCIDFSHPSEVLSHLKLAIEAGKPLIIGTTGWEELLMDAQKLVEANQGAALYSPNFSLGVALYYLLVERGVSLLSPFPLYEPAGVEYHHKAKVDAPSGTAKQIGALFEPKLNFASIRCGTIPGTHEVLWDSPEDSITITHTAKSREGFASGALLAAKWLQNKKGWWTFHDMVRSLYSPDHPFQKRES